MEPEDKELSECPVCYCLFSDNPAFQQLMQQLATSGRGLNEV